jgi:hypothetical protein
MVLRLAAAEVAGAYAEGKNHDEAESSTARKPQHNPQRGGQEARFPDGRKQQHPQEAEPPIKSHPA